MEIKEIRNRQLVFFRRGITKEYDFRWRALDRLEWGIRKYENEICSALKMDLNKSNTEAYMTEIGIVLTEIRYMKKHLRRFMRPEYTQLSKAQFPGRSAYYKDPYGIVLIISPWNYPFQLCMSPLIGSIAGGNCSILKLSEESPATSEVIERMIEEIFPLKYVAALQGDIKVSEQILNLRYDYIFFTGSPRVGKLVMKRASKYLTPVTLELGGKSPCIIDETADLDMAAKRILFGKLMNAGQTCVAPDYILIHESVKEAFTASVNHWIEQMLGKSPLENEDYPKIINEKHYDRILQMIEGQEQNILIGGKGSKETLKIEPTLVEVKDRNNKLMLEEIFGPILPIITFGNIKEAEEFVNRREKPLALYLFTEQETAARNILKNISFGGGCINDTLVHVASSSLAFGGVGNSGMGSYHGKASFDTFTHKKAVLKRYNWLDLAMRYHPFNEKKEELARRFL
jgi:aldehyde dehydrogenase (NAD+)